ncbi:dTDP-4-amino-4,6-dideoxygalactose transaminase [Catalinimonas alkaloidigena]|uniref:DegT/DnrJ/EryC1/StrS family aminotransferase n=1 Tax=Catalinimonas alkaloidigena TaxID=1075417 RepID=UPI0024056A08|nr:DegT/DnrJ/EryC1/StrS family aminotransferase [Catalinimonas alkaloidigena]MDF9801106.1 dTDP-4-amino-4,6-dideoxygalactose transaminase [Catalinimonas alkaloidigena]
MINVTQPFLPPKEEYDKYVEGIWKRNWLTNNGPLVNELEIQLKKYFGQKHLLFLTNGTVAIQIAIRALGLKGKIITTPFSYVATTSSIVWEHCEPLFVDIDQHTLNIDADKIEEAITDDVSGILATHCFGNSCDINAIEKIASKHKLKVIYDAAHCFGTVYKGKSIFAYGDVSTTSFHATKLFHTIEGGAVFTQNADLLKRMAYMRNFGHDGPEKFNGVGINGKNSEFHAAMGLVNLKYVGEIIQRRKEQSLFYDEMLQNLKVQKPVIQQGCDFNYAYYPVIFESEEIALKMKAELEKRNISPRRYFYPSLSSLDYVSTPSPPISDDIAKRILCLPLYHDLSREEQLMIVRILLRTQNY